ncbi:MAG: hypothetical protein JWN83_1495 [Chitinophagaceae bacterium]|nr:hypothetical protein [Chitinophagaceae bacterium]
MKNILRCAYITFLSAFTLASSAQTSITSGTITQTFDAMNATLNLPTNWKMSAAGTGTSTLAWLDGTNVTTTSFAANSGTPTTGGRYNWGTTAGTDRAIGFIADASYNSPNAIMAFYRNTSGATIQSFTVAFNIERYKTDVSTCSVSFYTSSDGITWQAQPLGDIGTSAFVPAAVSYSFGSPTTVARSLTFNSANLANNGNLYFKWVFVNTGSTTSQGLGLDDVAVTVNTATITASLGDILTDANTNGTANPGEVITYQDTIKNTGTANALSVVVADTTAPTGSTKVIASTKTSAVAVDDNYTASYNTQLTGQNVLTNDFGFPLPQVITYGTTASGGVTTSAGGTGATDNGGTIVITGGGAITYTPPTNFTGVDKFKYIAGTGVGLPNNDATVSITVNAAGITFTSAHTDPLCNGGATGTITITASGGSGTYLYSKDNGTNYQTSNVFTGLAAGTYNQLMVKDAITGSTSSTGSETLTNPVAVTFTFTKTDITCNNANNGTITFNTTTGGTSPYTYSIAGTGGTFQSGTGFTALTAAAYTLVAKDNNGCNSATTSSTVVNPAVVTVSGTTPVALTYNTAMSTVTYTKSGGTGTLTFSQTGTLPTGVTFTAGAGTLTGTPTQTGSFPITIIATDANGCTGNLSVTITVAPKLTNDSYNAVGNTQLAADGHSSPTTPFTTSATNILTNDQADVTPTVTAGTFATTNGGSITIDAAGKFTYTPLNGSTAADSYIYTATANGISATATINFTVAGMIWYVNNTYAGGNGAANGSSHRPYTTVNAAESASAINQIIYVHTGTGNTTGDALLKSGQTLRGAGSALSVGALTIGAGTKPTLTGMITLANSVTVDGFDMSTGATTAFTNAGATVTGVTVNVGSVTTTSGTGITLTGTGNSVTITLASLTTGSAPNAVNLTNTAGTVTINGGTITGGAGAAFNISGGTVSLTYSGSASQGTASQPLVSVSGGHATGTITFNTGTLAATSGIGLLFSNADGTYNFNGTTTLSNSGGGDAGIDINTGSGGTFNFSSGTSITDPTNEVIKIDAGTATVTYSGTFSKTNAAAGIIGILISNNTGGTITINGSGTKTLTTSTGNAISLTSNTGTTINFSGNNLLLTATTGTGFNATGGGTVNVTGTGNNITTTGGTALNWNGVTGTSTELFNNISSTTGGGVAIAGSSATSFTFNDVVSTTGTAVSINTATGAFSFHKISSNGAAKGIIVNALTGSGSFNITGTGGTGSCDATHIGAGDCAGGTIQGSTSRGAEFTNANNITLKNMYFKGNGITAVACVDDVGSGSNVACNAAIHVTSSNTVILDHIYVDGTGSNDMGILGNAVSALTATNVEVANFTNIAKVPVVLQNLSGTCPFTSLNVHNNNTIHTVFVTQNTGTSNITFTSPVLTNNNGTNNPDQLQVDAYSSANVTVAATNVNISSNSINTGNGVSFQASSGSTMNATLNGGTVTGTNGILMQETGNNTAFTFTVTGLTAVSTHNLGSNAITVGKGNGTNATFNGTVTNNVITSATCGGGCAGIKVASFGVSGASTVNVSGNNISGVDAQGIWVVGGQGSSSLTATIQNNNIHNPVAGNTSYAIDAYPGTQSGDAVCFALNLGDMSSGHSVSGNRNLITGSWQSGGNPIEIGIFNNSIFKLLNYPTPNTNDANAAAWVAASNGGLGTDAFHLGPNQFTAGSACPLLFARGGVGSSGHFINTSANSSYSITEKQLQSVVDGALVIWQKLGLNDTQMKQLRHIQFSIGKTAPGELGNKSDHGIVISINADGKGWFTGAGYSNSLFPNRITANKFITSSHMLPAGHVDLLSCILHEMGHVLGLKDLKEKIFSNDFMYAYLTVGERRIPTKKTVKKISRERMP